MQKPDVMFIHLTDLHVRDEASAALCRATPLARAIGSMREVSTHLVIIMSGDIAYFGSSDQYGLVKEFLTNLRAALSAWDWLSVTVLAAPGNHDNDYTCTDEFARQSLLQQVDQMPEDDLRAVTSLASVQRHFVEFRRSEFSNYQSFNVIQERAGLDLEGDLVVVDLINSAWCSVKDDQPGKLKLPTSALTPPPTSASLAIAAIHHPPNWYTPSDQRRLVECLDRSYEMVLWGHEHESDEVDRIRRKSGASVKFVIGNAFDPPSSEGVTPGFFAFQWNRRENDFRQVSFEWSGSHFTAKEDVWLGGVPANGARRSGAVKFTDEFSRILDDPGVAFTHPYVSRPIHLSDIFVYPEFHRVDGSRSIERRIGSDFRGVEFVDHLLLHKKSIIIGPEQSGKTSFAKMLILSASRKGKMPLYLDAQSLKSSNRGEVRAWIKSSQIAQYTSDGLEAFIQMEPADRIVVLDNAHLLPAGVEGANQIVSILSEFSRTTVIFSSQSPALAIIAGDSSGGRSESYWKAADVYDLLPLSHAGRSNVIRNWVSLGREGRVSEEEIESDVRLHKNALDQVLGRNFLPKFPLFVLILLQQFEAFKSSKAVVASGSHGYLFEALIVDAFEKHVRSFSIGMVFSYLALMARQMHDRDERFIAAAEQARFHVDFVSKKLVDIDRDVLLSELIAAQVLTRHAGGIGFRYQYLYYYFLAKNLSETIADASSQKHIDRLVDFVHTEQSANVLTFLAHLGGEADVVARLITRARGVFSDFKEVDVEDYSGLLQRFKTVRDRSVLLEGEARALSDFHDKKQDDLEGQRPDANDLPESDEVALQFNTSFKLLQILGQVLRSQAGRVDGVELVDIAECCIGLARRTLGSVYEMIESSPEGLVRDASAIFEKQLSVDKNRALDIANRFLAFLVVSIAVATTTKLAEAVGAAELLPVIELLERNSPDLTKRLLLVSARLAGERDFAGYAVKAFERDLPKNRILPRIVLAEMVTQRFFLRPPDRYTKQKFCELLNIETRRLAVNQMGRS